MQHLQKSVRWLLPAAIIAISHLICSDAFAEVVYAKYEKIPVKSTEKHEEATVLTRVPIGTDLTILSKSGPLYQIQTPGGKIGFVSRLHITEEKPANDKNNAKNPEIKLETTIKSASKDRETSSEILKSAEEFDSIVDRIDSKQVDRFLVEGKIGAYWDGKYR